MLPNIFDILLFGKKYSNTKEIMTKINITPIIIPNKVIIGSPKIIAKTIKIIRINPAT